MTDSPWRDWLEICRRMCAAAEAGRWVEVARLERTRRRHWPAGVPVPPALAPALAAADRRLLALAGRARDDAAAELARAQRGDRARRAYASVAPD